jgi:hypothetical protein
MGSGKSRLARELQGAYGGVILPLALAVKEDICLYHGITLAYLNAHKADFRSRMQEHGHGMRAKGAAYWLGRWADRVHSIERLGAAHLFVDDVRYMNEARYARSINALVVRVTVPEDVRIQRLIDVYGRKPSPEEINHPSESDVPNLPVDFEFPGDISQENMLATFLMYYDQHADLHRHPGVPTAQPGG